MKKRSLVVLSGCTASGKTKIAESLNKKSKKFEFISADTLQVIEFPQKSNNKFKQDLQKFRDIFQPQ